MKIIAILLICGTVFATNTIFELELIEFEAVEIDPNTMVEAKILKIVDGDTYKVIANGYTQNIRLARVDCAETSLRHKLFKDCLRSKTVPSFQLALGKRATEAVKSMNISNLWITMDSTKNVDRWNRDLYWCYLDSTTNIYNSLNYILLLNGLGKFDYQQIPFPTEEIKTAMELADINKREILPDDSQKIYFLNDVNTAIETALNNQKQMFLQQLQQAQKDAANN